MLRNKKILMLLSLVIAVCLWAYVMGTVDPSVKRVVTGISVEMQGQETLEELNLKATLNSPKTMGITVEGKRSQVNKLKAEDIEAYIDVSTCDYGKNEKEITVNLPDGMYSVEIKKMTKDTAVFTVK